MNPEDEDMTLPTVQNTDDSVQDDGAISTPLPNATQQGQPMQTPVQQSPPQQLHTTVDPLNQQHAMQQFADDGLDADDVDLIEKSWVEKAKNIVSETMGNPHTQSVEINKMKADYIKKRYNKEIKGSE